MRQRLELFMRVISHPKDVHWPCPYRLPASSSHVSAGGKINNSIFNISYCQLEYTDKRLHWNIRVSTKGLNSINRWQQTSFIDLIFISFWCHSVQYLPWWNTIAINICNLLKTEIKWTLKPCLQSLTCIWNTDECKYAWRILEKIISTDVRLKLIRCWQGESS